MIEMYRLGCCRVLVAAGGDCGLDQNLTSKKHLPD